MTNVYLLVTDLHLDVSKANRVNYLGELVSSILDIIEIANTYTAMGYSVNLVLMGDVCDGSLSNSSDAMQILEILRFVCSKFTKTYAVVGNHEITYAKDNPFWFLVSNIADSSLNSIQRYIQPKGLNETILIPDILVDGNVSIAFNHFGVSAKTIVGDCTKIGLFHQNVGSNDICKMWGTFDNVEEASCIQSYHYCFFGHMHLARGKYYLNESHTCQGIWLGTIGRTKVTEIDDSNLSVNIPAIIVRDGNFVYIEDNYITLPPFKDSVDLPKYKASQESKLAIEKHREIATRAYKGDTLFDTLKGSVLGTVFDYLVDLLDSSWLEIEHEYSTSLESIGGESEDG